MRESPVRFARTSVYIMPKEEDMPRWNCSLLERIARKLEYDPFDGRVYWHGRWLPPRNYKSHKQRKLHPKGDLNPINLDTQPYAVFSPTSGAVISVTRFMFFQMYDNRTMPAYTTYSFQTRIRLMYDRPMRKNEVNFVLLHRPGPDLVLHDVDQFIIQASIVADYLNENNPSSYQPIPLTFPEVFGTDRIALVMHYLRGGTDQTLDTTPFTQQPHAMFVNAIPHTHPYSHSVNQKRFPLCLPPKPKGSRKTSQKTTNHQTGLTESKRERF